MEYSSAAVAIMDKKAVIEYINPAFSKMFGFSPGEAKGQNPWELLSTDGHSSTFYSEMWEKLRTVDKWQGEWRTRQHANRFG